MRHTIFALAGLAATLSATAPAFALNPQPLPPGIHQPKNQEPPDPCLRYRKHPRAYARCVREHPGPFNEGWERDSSRHPGGRGQVKPDHRGGGDPSTQERGLTQD